MHPSALSSVPSVSSAVHPSASSASSAVNPSASADDPDSDPDPDPRTLTRREEAFTLYCQGYRSPAIAGLLGVPQRTVRAWIAATLQQTADDARTRRDHQLRLAIESQRAIVKAAWQAYDRAARAERLTLEHLQNAVPLNVDDTDFAPDLAPTFGDPDPYGPPARRRSGGASHGSPAQGVRSALPRLPTLGARYLQIVLHAQREIARLSGLYHLPDAFFDPNAGRPMQIVIRRDPHLPREQLVAWTAFRQQWDADHPDDPVPPDDRVFPPVGAPLHDYADPEDPADPDADLDGPDTDGPDTDDPGSLNPYGIYPDHEPPADRIENLDRAVPDDLQSAQAGFVAGRPLGADSSAGPPAPRSTQSETAAETAIPCPPFAPVASPDFSPPAACAGPSEPRSPAACAGPSEPRSPAACAGPPTPRSPAACAGSSVPRSPAACAGSSEPRSPAAATPASPPSPPADIPTTVHPSLLPRFRRRSSLPPSRSIRFGGIP